MQTAQPFPHGFVDDAVVRDGGFPAHAAEPAEGLHAFTVRLPTNILGRSRKGLVRIPIARPLPVRSARALNRSRAARRTRLYPPGRPAGDTPLWTLVSPAALSLLKGQRYLGGAPDHGHGTPPLLVDCLSMTRSSSSPWRRISSLGEADRTLSARIGLIRKGKRLGLSSRSLSGAAPLTRA